LDSDIYISKEKQSVTVDNQTKEEIDQVKSNTNHEDNMLVTDANLAEMKPLNNANLEDIKPVVKLDKNTAQVSFLSPGHWCAIQLI
jgi:hypothetical protein